MQLLIKQGFSSVNVCAGVSVSISTHACTPNPELLSATKPAGKPTQLLRDHTENTTSLHFVQRDLDVTGSNPW